MKKIFLSIMVIASVIVLSGCTLNLDTYDYKYGNMVFKELYESLNGNTNQKGAEHRTIEIPEDNPYVPVDAQSIVDMMENGETFYVYFGFVSCPWCRSVLEKGTEIANKNNVEKIYYVNVHDIRDTLEVDKKGNVNKTNNGSDAYNKLLKLLDNVLSEYSLQDEKGNKVETNEKRIYAPNFVYIKDGKAIKLESGISDLQTDPRQDLTDDILADEEKKFNEFFKE